MGGIGGTLLACRVRPAAFPFLFIYIFHLAKQMNTEMRTVVYANTVYAPRRSAHTAVAAHTAAHITKPG